VAKDVSGSRYGETRRWIPEPREKPCPEPCPRLAACRTSIARRPLADNLAAAFPARGRQAERLNALIRLAVDFWTWRRLSREGLDDDAAAD
jgi:hypothetical protein